MILEEVNESFLLHCLTSRLSRMVRLWQTKCIEREEPQRLRGILQVIIVQLMYESQANMRLLDWSVNMYSNADQQSYLKPFSLH